jgi:pyruvate dehydrogenase E2 component (dihydrolipoamide acetyltransferase)
MEEGNIVEWLKEEGDEVEPGDILAEVETDKATMELESYHEGVLLHIGVKEGPVPVNEVIAVIGEEGEDYEAQLKEAQEESQDDEEKEEEKEKEEKTEESQEKETKEEEKTTQKEQDERIKASPLAKKMAEEAGLDLSKIEGSGDGGRIIKRDIEEYKEKKQEAPSAAPGVLEGEEVEEMPVSQMRKTIAKRLSESKFTAPHFYLSREINMDKAIEARKKINEMDDIKISFNDLIVKACAVALTKHPMVNASWKGDKIIKHKKVNVGVAVAVEEGLVVPVIDNTNFKSLSQINDEVKDKAARAREKKLTTEEMQGNTFTVSNLGMFDIEEFTAIINPPDSCILAVGSIKQKAVVENDEIKVGNRMKITLSCDHRVVDGATGAQFLQTLSDLLEEPLRLVV